MEDRLLRERLEDLVCNNCLLAPTCTDHVYHCTAFEKLHEIYKMIDMLRRILDNC